MNIHVFDIWSDFGHFRKYDTNNPTMLTFDIPPRTAIIGMLGAIIGVERNDSHLTFTSDNCFISIQQISNDGKIIKMQNYLKDWVKGGCNQSVIRVVKNPSAIEEIRNPRYRIYFHHKDDSIMKKLVDMISGHERVYQPYLGNVKYIANYEYVGGYEFDETSSDDTIEFSSIVKKQDGTIFNTINAQLSLNTMCRAMGKDRTPIEYGVYCHNKIGNVVCTQTAKYYHCNELNINIMEM